MSSLQFADISPTYEQIENLNTSGLLFVLSNPSVDTDIKIYCSELLVKQGRINSEFLSEAYLLPKYDNVDLENSLNLYKTLSPAKARPLLYQSIITEKNEEMKFQKIIALLKVSIIDNLFSKISSLVSNFVKQESISSVKEQILLISKMFQTQKKFDKATEVLNLIEDDNDLDFIFREISIELAKNLSSNSLNSSVLEEKIKKLEKINDLNSQKYQKILMNLMLSYELTQPTSSVLNNLNFSSNEKLSNNSLHSLFLAETYSKKKNLFNSMRILFKTINNKSFEELTVMDSYKVLSILKNLGFEKEFNEISYSLIE